MIKILFICHGNICRSPMAEFIFKDLAEKRGVMDRFYVSSSATSSEEIFNGRGSPVYPPAKAQLNRHGIDCGGKRAVQLKSEDYSNYDMFIGMDEYNIRNMRRILKGDAEGKIYKLMDFTSRGGDVADPWYSGAFKEAFDDIKEGCEALMNHLIDM